MAWANPIVGGGNALIREEIKSPDYVAGVSGWTIKKDGSAEFNDVDVRGELFLDGADGSYIDIELVGGTAPFITIRPADNGITDRFAGGINIQNETVGSSQRADMTISSSGFGGSLPGFAGCEVQLKSQAADGSTLPQFRVLNGSNPNTAIDIDLRGNVEIMGTFSRPGCVVSFGTPNITSGVVAQTITLTALVDSYGMFNAGTPTVVTIPKDGWYEVGMVLRYGSQATNANLRQMKFLVNGVEHMQWNFPAVSNMNGTNITLNGVTQVELAEGDTITFQTLQNSGATLNIVANSRGWVRMVEG